MTSVLSANILHPMENSSVLPSEHIIDDEYEDWNAFFDEKNPTLTVIMGETASGAGYMTEVDIKRLFWLLPICRPAIEEGKQIKKAKDLDMPFGIGNIMSAVCGIFSRGSIKEKPFPNAISVCITANNGTSLHGKIFKGSFKLSGMIPKDNGELISALTSKISEYIENAYIVTQFALKHQPFFRKLLDTCQGDRYVLKDGSFSLDTSLEVGMPPAGEESNHQPLPRGPARKERKNGTVLPQECLFTYECTFEDLPMETLISIYKKSTNVQQLVLRVTTSSTRRTALSVHSSILPFEREDVDDAFSSEFVRWLREIGCPWYLSAKDVRHSIALPSPKDVGRMIDRYSSALLANVRAYLGRDTSSKNVPAVLETIKRECYAIYDHIKWIAYDLHTAETLRKIVDEVFRSEPIITKSWTNKNEAEIRTTDMSTRDEDLFSTNTAHLSQEAHIQELAGLLDSDAKTCFSGLDIFSPIPRISSSAIIEDSYISRYMPVILPKTQGSVYKNSQTGEEHHRAGVKDSRSDLKIKKRIIDPSTFRKPLLVRIFSNLPPLDCKNVHSMLQGFGEIRCLYIDTISRDITIWYDCKVADVVQFAKSCGYPYDELVHSRGTAGSVNGKAVAAQTLAGTVCLGDEDLSSSGSEESSNEACSSDETYEEPLSGSQRAKSFISKTGSTTHTGKNDLVNRYTFVRLMLLLDVLMGYAPDTPSETGVFVAEELRDTIRKEWDALFTQRMKEIAASRRF